MSVAPSSAPWLASSTTPIWTYHSFEWYCCEVEPPLTSIQATVLEAVRRRIDHGEPVPTHRDLCAEFGWASTATARDHLQALARKGYLEIEAGHRNMRISGDRPAVARVPRVGRVVAGTPVFAEENLGERIPLPAEWIGRGAHFVLGVTGDSMEGEGILEGDEVVVRKQVHAADGDLVVAMIDGETTLKRLRIKGRRTTLVPANPRYAPIEICTASSAIQGVVVGLLRRYR